MSMFYRNIDLHTFSIRMQSDVSPILYSGLTRISRAVQIFNCQSARCPCGQKGNCALLVPKHTQGTTVNCQVYVTTIHILLQALF